MSLPSGTVPAEDNAIPPVAEPVPDLANAVLTDDGVQPQNLNSPLKSREMDLALDSNDLVPKASASTALADYPDALAVEGPEGDVLTCTAGPLYRIISEIGKTLAHHDSQIIQPTWLPDLRARVDRTAKIEPRLEEISKITAEILKHVAESDSKVKLQQQLAKVENNEVEEIPLPINVKLKENVIQIEKVEKRLALTPTTAEISQLREQIVNRCKQIQTEMSDLHSDAEYRFEEKLDAHLTKFRDWEQNVARGVRNRFEVMENNWETAQDDLKVFRMRLNDTLEKINENVEEKTRAVKLRQDGADSRVDVVDQEIEKLRGRASEIEETAVPTLDAKIAGVLKQLEDFELVTNQGFEIVRTVANEHDSLLSNHRNELDAHMKEIVAHFGAIGKNEGRIVQHDATLRQHLASIDNHTQRVETLETFQKKTVKNIQEMKTHADEQQNYVLGLINQTNSDVATVRIAGEKVQKQADTTQADLKLLKEHAEEEARKLADVTMIQHEHHDNLETLNKQVGFIRGKVGQIDMNAENIGKLEDGMNSANTRAEAMQEHMRNVEVKAKEAEDGLHATRATTSQVRSFMDDGFDKSDKKHRSSEKSIEELKENVTELQIGAESMLVTLAKKDKKPPIGEKMGTTLNAAQRREIYLANVNAFAQLCYKFEQHILARKKLTNMNSDFGMQLGGVAMEVAEYLANITNMEAITKVVLLKPDETPLNNEDLSQMREDKVQKFIDDYHNDVENITKAESGLRKEARLYFLEKLDAALDMGMSKFDQVLVPAGSLVSKLQVPTCVSCDRPLPGKRRAKDLYGTVAQQEYYGEMPQIQRVDEDGKPIPMPVGDANPAEGLKTSGPIELRSRSGDPEGNLPPLPALKEDLNKGRPVTAPASANANAALHTYPMTTGSGPTSLGAPDVLISAEDGDKFVKRGGFKLPAPESPHKLKPLMSSKHPQSKWKDVEDARNIEEAKEGEFELTDSEDEGGDNGL